MKVGLMIGAMAGIALGTFLVLYYGLDDVAHAVAAAGVTGFLAVTVVRIIAIALCGWAMDVLYTERQGGGTLHLFIWSRWLRDSVTNLLGIVPGAGEVAGVRALTLHAIPPQQAIATTIVDTTTELLSQLVFTLMGLTIIMAAGLAAPTMWWALAGLGIATAGVVAFVIAQKRGLFRLIETLPYRLGLTKSFADPEAVGGTHAAIQRIYERRDVVGTSAFLHLLAWLIGTADAWVALRLMGHPIGVGDAIAIESLAFALRAVAFFVPSALGVQEGGYIVIGDLFGIGPDAMLALSLLKRATEIAIGVPAILIWQFFEGQYLWQGSEEKIPSDTKSTGS